MSSGKDNIIKEGISELYSTYINYIPKYEISDTDKKMMKKNRVKISLFLLMMTLLAYILILN